MSVSKKIARTLYDAAVEGVKPQNLLKNNSFLTTLASHQIYLFGSGKAAVEMAKSLEALFKEKILGGVIVSPYTEKLQYVDVLEGSHPIPTQKSIDAAQKLKSKLASLKESDLYVYLLSGGSSALIEEPIAPITLSEMQHVTDLLLSSGAAIDEINIVRKHLSNIKGGRLASVTKAKGMVLVVSDVIGDDLESIGSAPMYCDSSTYADTKAVLEKYAIFDKVPQSVQNVIHEAKEESPKTPVEGLEHIMVGTNKIALEYAKRKAEEMGLTCEIVTDTLQGDVRIVADEIASKIKSSDKDCLLFGGEATVVVKGDGKGGRNQELCLHVLKNIQDENITFLSAGSDGIDGNSDAAGAVVDSDSYKEDIDKFLDNNDSYHFHQRNNDLIITGPSGTNVMDIMIAIKKGVY